MKFRHKGRARGRKSRSSYSRHSRRRSGRASKRGILVARGGIRL